MWSATLDTPKITFGADFHREQFTFRPASLSLRNVNSDISKVQRCLWRANRIDVDYKGLQPRHFARALHSSSPVAKFRWQIAKRQAFLLPKQDSRDFTSDSRLNDSLIYSAISFCGWNISNFTPRKVILKIDIDYVDWCAPIISYFISRISSRISYKIL